MMQMRLDLETISIVTAQSSQQQIELQGTLMSNLSGVHERIARVEEMLCDQADQVRENQLKQVGSLYNISAVNGRAPRLRSRALQATHNRKGSASVLDITV